LKDFHLRAPELSELLIAKVWQVFMMRTKWQLPRMECSRKCVKSAVAGSRQGEVLQLWVSAGQLRPTTVKRNSMLRNVSASDGFSERPVTDFSGQSRSVLICSHTN
jgi:hypothetical protein